MRTIMIVALLVARTGSAFAQEIQEVRLKPDTTAVGQKPDTPVTPATIAASSGCWPVTTRDRVVVKMDGGVSLKGTLLCMGPDEVMLTGSGTLALSKILQISKPRDSELDGMLKGAAVGLLIAALCAGECETEYLVRATFGYAAIGAVIDSLQGNEKVLYRREQKVAVGFRLRF